MMTNEMLKKLAFICVYYYIIVNNQCSINAAVLKTDYYDLNKIHNLVLPIHQKITRDTMRHYPLLGYKLKKCLSHYYKNLRKPKEYIEYSEEIGRVPKKDSYIIKITHNHDSNQIGQFLKVPSEKHMDIKSEEMEINGLPSTSSVAHLFNAIIVGEQTAIEPVEDQELYDGIIIGESEEEDNETTFQPIMKYFETVKSDRRMTQFDSDTQSDETAYDITVFAAENNKNKMIAHVIEKLLLEIHLDAFMKILIDYTRTHNDELTFNKLKKILSKRRGKLPCISDELRRKLSVLGNTPLPRIYFDIRDR